MPDAALRSRAMPDGAGPDGVMPNAVLRNAVRNGIMPDRVLRNAALINRVLQSGFLRGACLRCRQGLPSRLTAAVRIPPLRPS